MSFSLGLRALLHPCAAEGPSKQIIQEVVSHFDDLWDDRTGAWAVKQGHDASTTGSYAVLSAVRALKNAWQFDPALVYGVNRNAHAAPSEKNVSADKRAGHGTHSQRQVRLVPGKQGIYISDPELSDREFFVSWDSKAKSQWGILEAMLLRKQKANNCERPDQYDYTLSPEDLAVYAKSEAIDPATVDRTIRRINKRIAEAAAQVRIHSFPVLIEKIIPGDSDDARYGIEETNVVIGSSL